MEFLNIHHAQLSGAQTSIGINKPRLTITDTRPLILNADTNLAITNFFDKHHVFRFVSAQMNLAGSASGVFALSASGNPFRE